MAGAKTQQTGSQLFARLSRGVRCRSYDSLDSLHHIASKAAEVPAPAFKLRQPVHKARQTEVTPHEVSRLELLLIKQTPKPVFTPEEDTTFSHATNKAIRLSSQWTEVQDAVLNAPTLSSSNLAFTLYRLGCISAFDSKKRRNDLNVSKLVPKVFDLAMSKLDLMEPASLVLLLDGCARLQHRPTNNELMKIATFVKQHAAALDARQIPLVLWAFSALDYRPGVQILIALENAVSSRASELSPQGMALTLSSFHSAQHAPKPLTLERLSEVMQRQLLLFKPSDLAISLRALSNLGHLPTPDFVKAIAERTGQPQVARLGTNEVLGLGLGLSLAV